MVKDIHSWLENMYGEQAPSLATVKQWEAEFKQGQESIEDNPRSRCPVEATAPEKVAEVETIVMTDPRVKIVEVTTV